jgi:hypothetical protein
MLPHYAPLFTESYYLHMYTYIEGHCAKIMGCCTSNVPTVKVAAAAAQMDKSFASKWSCRGNVKLSTFFKFNYRENGILLPKLF